MVSEVDCAVDARDVSAVTLQADEGKPLAATHKARTSRDRISAGDTERGPRLVRQGPSLNHQDLCQLTWPAGFAHPECVHLLGGEEPVPAWHGADGAGVGELDDAALGDAELLGYLGGG